MRFQAAARAIRGSKEVQEDAWRIFGAKGDNAEEAAGGNGASALAGGLLLVADGIGGHHGGDVASKITADIFVSTFFAGSGNTEARLRTSLEAANQAVGEAQRKDSGLKDMGATLVAGYLDGETMSFVSVGDSLILRYRDGELHRVNMDHSYMEIADREALGSGDPALWREVMTRKGRDAITIAVLGRELEDFGHSPQIESRKILPGDVMIFSSDGLETLTMVQIQNFVRELLPRGVAAVADGLIKAVDGIGGNRNYQDNATLIVAQADGGSSATKMIPQGERESAKTAASAPAATAVSAAAPATPSGSISENARSGRWSPAKLVLGIALGLLVVSGALFATGKLNMFRAAKVDAPAGAQEKGLQPAPALTPESDSPAPRKPDGSGPPKGGHLASPLRMVSA